jgi:hypothetical protein
MQLTHFSAALIFGIFASVVFGITQKDGQREQVKYGLRCFAYFVGGTILASWVMWVIRR